MDQAKNSTQWFPDTIEAHLELVQEIRSSQNISSYLTHSLACIGNQLEEALENPEGPEAKRIQAALLNEQKLAAEVTSFSEHSEAGWMGRDNTGAKYDFFPDPTHSKVGRIVFNNIDRSEEYGRFVRSDSGWVYIQK